MNVKPADNDVGAGLKSASVLLRAGSVQQALDLLERLDVAHPGRVEVMRMRGIVLARIGRPAAAEPLLRAVADASPRSTDAAGDHAQVLLGLGRADEALERLLPLCPVEPEGSLEDHGPVFAYNLGMAYKAAGRASEAVEPLETVLRFKPGHYAALIGLGDVNKALGRIEAAAAHYRAAIRSQPDAGTAWWSLSNLKSGGFTGDERETLRGLAGGVGRATEEQVFFEFALATALDAAGDEQAAFEHYARGNRLKRESAPWDRHAFGQWMEALRTAMSDLRLPERGETPGVPRPVFIVSLPRSGSTLTEQILAAHSAVTGASELPWLPRIVADVSRRRGSGLARWAVKATPEDWAALGREYLEKCRHWYRQTPVFTDKLPGNLPYIGVMLAMHPDSRVVAVRRDPMDVCWSCYRQLFISGSEFSYDFDDLAAYWRESERQMTWWAERVPDRVKVVDYEALVAEPERETRALLDFAGLPFEEACLRPQDARRAVATASAAQVRQAIHRSGVGHWKRYGRFLEPLREALEREGV
ncbi:tetratricopeptide repeat-containing sulfotransferase family protein [Elongatibacter sediminis]|uniref:Sulfotransferase n=1 Tax=Elongatibacter sediminis TaxID=3119006 RepID=A0AAW9RBN2_9GAMM